MLILPTAELQDIGTALLDAIGSPHEQSAWVAETLVRASLMGHDSHGIVRFTQYINQVRNGEIKPGARITVDEETAATAVVNGHLGWGQVTARHAMNLAIDKASRSAVGVVVVQDCPHAGRIGEYATMAAEHQMIGYVVANSHGGGAAVVPWGGIDRRFTPNPIAFAAPSGEAWPMLMDITTSTVPEGKVRVARHRGESLPPGCIIDTDGNPATDPAVFYGPPPGALLPLGGAFGHKGYGLTIMTEILAGILSGAGFSREAVPTRGNGLFMQAINIAAFTSMGTFTRRMREMAADTKSSRRGPGVDEILFPGEPEYRMAQKRSREGIPVEDSVWAEIQAAASELGVVIRAGGQV